MTGARRGLAAAVAPFVPRLLLALVDCFKDESWPVRDAACGACGKCVGAFPEEVRGNPPNPGPVQR